MRLRGYRWTRDRIQRHGDAHPLAGNNVTRLPVRHRHVHALDWLDPAFSSVATASFFFFLLLISSDSRLRKRSRREIPFDRRAGLDVLLELLGSLTAAPGPLLDLSTTLYLSRRKREHLFTIQSRKNR